jgi:type IV secretory pathway TraG/TraD family ATPase VirD4
VHALLYLREKEGIKDKLNFEDIKDKISAAELEEIHKRLKEHKHDKEAARMVKDLKKVVESGSDYYSKISSSLRVALMELTTGNTGTIMGNVRGNDIIEKLEKGEGVIFLAQLGSLLTSKTASTVSRVLISMLKTLAGRKYASGKVLNPPLVLYADEAHNLLFHGFETMVSQVGSANFAICGFSQSINQIYAAMGDMSKGRSIIDNINTKIYMRAPDEETAKYASEHFGTVKNLNTILNIQGTANFREVKDEMVKKEVILGLQTQEFLMTTHSGRYMGSTATTNNSYINIVYPSA